MIAHVTDWADSIGAVRTRRPLSSVSRWNVLTRRDASEAGPDLAGRRTGPPASRRRSRRSCCRRGPRRGRSAAPLSKSRSVSSFEAFFGQAIQRPSAGASVSFSAGKRRSSSARRVVKRTTTSAPGLAPSFSARAASRVGLLSQAAAAPGDRLRPELDRVRRDALVRSVDERQEAEGRGAGSSAGSRTSGCPRREKKRPSVTPICSSGTGSLGLELAQDAGERLEQLEVRLRRAGVVADELELDVVADRVLQLPDQVVRPKPGRSPAVELDLDLAGTTLIFSPARTIVALTVLRSSGSVVRAAGPSRSTWSVSSGLSSDAHQESLAARGSSAGDALERSRARRA